MRLLLALVAVCLVAAGTTMFLLPPAVPDETKRGITKWLPVCMYMVALIVGATFMLTGVHILWEMPGGE